MDFDFQMLDACLQFKQLPQLAIDFEDQEDELIKTMMAYKTIFSSQELIRQNVARLNYLLDFKYQCIESKTIKSLKQKMQATIVKKERDMVQYDVDKFMQCCLDFIVQLLILDKAKILISSPISIEELFELNNLKAGVALVLDTCEIQEFVYMVRLSTFIKMIISLNKPSYLKQLKELQSTFRLIPEACGQNSPEMDILVKKLKREDVLFEDTEQFKKEIPPKIQIPKPFEEERPYVPKRREEPPKPAYDQDEPYVPKRREERVQQDMNEEPLQDFDTLSQSVSTMCKNIMVNNYPALKRDFDDHETELILIMMRYRVVFGSQLAIFTNWPRLKFLINETVNGFNPQTLKEFRTGLSTGIRGAQMQDIDTYNFTLACKTFLVNVMRDQVNFVTMATPVTAEHLMNVSAETRLTTATEILHSTGNLSYRYRIPVQTVMKMILQEDFFTLDWKKAEEKVQQQTKPVAMQMQPRSNYAGLDLSQAPELDIPQPIPTRKPSNLQINQPRSLTPIRVQNQVQPQIRQQVQQTHQYQQQAPQPPQVSFQPQQPQPAQKSNLQEVISFKSVENLANTQISSQIVDYCTSFLAEMQPKLFEFDFNKQEDKLVKTMLMAKLLFNSPELCKQNEQLVSALLVKKSDVFPKELRQSMLNQLKKAVIKNEFGYEYDPQIFIEKCMDFVFTLMQHEEAFLLINSPISQKQFSEYDISQIVQIILNSNEQLRYVFAIPIRSFVYMVMLTREEFFYEVFAQSIQKWVLKADLQTQSQKVDLLIQTAYKQIQVQIKPEMLQQSVMKFNQASTDQIGFKTNSKPESVQFSNIHQQKAVDLTVNPDFNEMMRSKINLEAVEFDEPTPKYQFQPKYQQTADQIRFLQQQKQINEEKFRLEQEELQRIQRNKPVLSANQEKKRLQALLQDAAEIVEELRVKKQILEGYVIKALNLVNKNQSAVRIKVNTIKKQLSPADQTIISKLNYQKGQIVKVFQYKIKFILRNLLKYSNQLNGKYQLAGDLKTQRAEKLKELDQKIKRIHDRTFFLTNLRKQRARLQDLADMSRQQQFELETKRFGQ
uniref:Uncharacterized protein n=1 Tax=Trepomonas sp. PC1 TaxID=1076344 RepID=A0A146K4L0_9EUKA|eukprot:JAP90429.1 Hypothetical protein TPC1_30076 [Trepomonas sp. PC1]